MKPFGLHARGYTVIASIKTEPKPVKRNSSNSAPGVASHSVGGAKAEKPPRKQLLISGICAGRHDVVHTIVAVTLSSTFRTKHAEDITICNWQSTLLD